MGCTCTHLCIHMHTHTACTRTHACMQAQVHICTHLCTHSCIHMHTQHACTHAHTPHTSRLGCVIPSGAGVVQAAPNAPVTQALSALLNQECCHLEGGAHRPGTMNQEGPVLWTSTFRLSESAQEAPGFVPPFLQLVPQLP